MVSSYKLINLEHVDQLVELNNFNPASILLRTATLSSPKLQCNNFRDKMAQLEHLIVARYSTRSNNCEILSIMKNLIFRIFNLTVGKVIRLFQRTLIIRDSPQGVFHFIQQQAAQDSAQYALNNFSNAMQFNTKTELWSYCLNRIPQIKTAERGGGIIAEFGVWKGKSINFFARNCPKAKVFGFDSFEGLEEDWHGTRKQKGYLALMVNCPNVKQT